MLEEQPGEVTWRGNTFVTLVSTAATGKSSYKSQVMDADTSVDVDTSVETDTSEETDTDTSDNTDTVSIIAGTVVDTSKDTVTNTRRDRNTKTGEERVVNTKKCHTYL